MEDELTDGRVKPYRRLLIALSLLVLLVTGISSCSLPDLSEFLPSDSPTESPGEVITTLIPTPTPTPEAQLPQIQQLVIWVPPQFDPRAETTAGALFADRLTRFKARRPQVDIEVRVKPLDGEFGLLDTLQITEAAAPILLPNLIALPRELMVRAAANGWILPLDEYTDQLVENDWYDYSLELARIEDQVYGIPFAGDLQVLAYKNDAEDLPPPDWEAVLESGKTVAFPASDPGALSTLAQLHSLGGELDTAAALEEGFNPDLLLEVLTYYQQGQAAGVMPYWLTQFETDGEAWLSYQDRQSTLAITWSSTLLMDTSPNTALAPLPTKEGKAFAYADGWVWGVVPASPEEQQTAAELAEFLTEAEYLAAWSPEGGYLPVRPSELDGWAESEALSSLQKLLPTARLIPDADFLDQAGPLLRDAVVSVLKDQVEPAAALQEYQAGIAAP